MSKKKISASFSELLRIDSDLCFSLLLLLTRVDTKVKR